MKLRKVLPVTPTELNALQVLIQNSSCAMVNILLRSLETHNGSQYPPNIHSHSVYLFSALGYIANSVLLNATAKSILFTQQINSFCIRLNLRKKFFSQGLFIKSLILILWSKLQFISFIFWHAIIFT